MLFLYSVCFAQLIFCWREEQAMGNHSKKEWLCDFCQIQDFQDSSQGHLITFQGQNSKNYERQIAHLLTTQSCVKKHLFC